MPQPDQARTIPSPLHELIWQGRLPSAAAALEAGEPVDALNKNGETALLTAVDDCYLPAVQLLVEKGANVHAKDARGFTPIVRAVFSKVLNKFEVIPYLLDQGADPNSCIPDGRSLLHLAVEWKKDELVAKFLEKNADPNITPPFGKSPLHVAAFNGDLAIASNLLRHGAQVNRIWRDNGSTPLVWALMKRCEDVAILLIKHGGEVPEATQELRYSTERLRAYVEKLKASKEYKDKEG